MNGKKVHIAYGYCDGTKKYAETSEASFTVFCCDV
jgi:hypothetical protein